MIRSFLQQLRAHQDRLLYLSDIGTAIVSQLIECNCDPRNIRAFQFDTVSLLDAYPASKVIIDQIAKLYHLPAVDSAVLDASPPPVFAENVQNWHPEISDYKDDVLNDDNSRVQLFAIFDGHGGDAYAADLAKTMLPFCLALNEKYQTGDYENALKQVVLQLHHIIKSSPLVCCRSDQHSGGSTISIALRTKQHTFFAWAGDSPIVIYNSDGTWSMPKMHDSDNKECQERILSSNIPVMSDDDVYVSREKNHCGKYPRFGTGLNVFGGIGDASNDPDILVRIIELIHSYHRDEAWHTRVSGPYYLAPPVKGKRKLTCPASEDSYKKTKIDDGAAIVEKKDATTKEFHLFDYNSEILYELGGWQNPKAVWSNNRFLDFSEWMVCKHPQETKGVESIGHHCKIVSYKLSTNEKLHPVGNPDASDMVIYLLGLRNLPSINITTTAMVRVPDILVKKNDEMLGFALMTDGVSRNNLYKSSFQPMFNFSDGWTTCMNYFGKMSTGDDDRAGICYWS